MSDSKLRELERRWKETGTVEDEAAYLQERVRCGDLSETMLRLAAYLEYEPALQALQDRCPEGPYRIEEWMQGLVKWGESVSSRACVAIAAFVLSYCEDHCRVNNTLYSVVSAMEQFVVMGDGAAKEALISLRSVMQRIASNIPDDAYDERDRKMLTADYVVCSINHAVNYLCASSSSNIPYLAARTGACAHAMHMGAETTRVGEEKIWSVICKELIPWALGYSDSVRERVEARQKTETP